jgi:hypothetical protein
MWYLLLFDGNNCFANASFYVHCLTCLYRRYYDGACLLPSSLPSFHPRPTFLSLLTHLNFILLFLLISLLLYFRNLFFFPTLHYSILDSFTNLFSSFLLVILTSLLVSFFPFLSYCVCHELVWPLIQNVTCLCYRLKWLLIQNVTCLCYRLKWLLTQNVTCLCYGLKWLLIQNVKCLCYRLKCLIIHNVTCLGYRL